MLFRPVIFSALILAAPTLAFGQTSSATPGNSPASAAPTSGSVAQYSSQSDAASKCSGDTVVWANPNSKALHVSGDRYFGKSKHGFYACEKDAMAGGYHMAGHHRKHAAKQA